MYLLNWPRMWRLYRLWRQKIVPSYNVSPHLTKNVKTAQIMKAESTTDKQMSNLWKVSLNSDLLSTIILQIFPENAKNVNNISSSFALLTTHPNTPHHGHHDPLHPEGHQPVLLIPREWTKGGIVLAPIRIVLKTHIAGIEVTVTDTEDITDTRDNTDVDIVAITKYHNKISICFLNNTFFLKLFFKSHKRI